jgi:hypothetical protein
MPLHPSVRHILELGEQFTRESELPREEKEAVRYCIASGMACLKPVIAVVPIDPHPARRHRLFADRRVGLCAPWSHLDKHPNFPLRLVLTDKGEAALAEDRLDDVTPQAKEAADLGRMRAAIRAHGREAKAAKLICEAGINRKKGYKLLRQLEALGEYAGFGSKPRRRYRHQVP